MQPMDAGQAEKFEQEIGMRFDPVQEAQAALRAHQAAAGIVIENPGAPVAPDAKSIALAEDEELGPWMGSGRR
jgi:hypothetical protein